MCSNTSRLNFQPEQKNMFKHTNNNGVVDTTISTECQPSSVAVAAKPEKVKRIVKASVPRKRRISDDDYEFLFEQASLLSIVVSSLRDEIINTVTPARADALPIFQTLCSETEKAAQILESMSAQMEAEVPQNKKNLKKKQIGGVVTVEESRFVDILNVYSLRVSGSIEYGKTTASLSSVLATIVIRALVRMKIHWHTMEDAEDDDYTSNILRDLFKRNNPNIREEI